MKLADVAKAIRTRLTGDATLVALLGASSNIRTGQIPSSSNIGGNLLVMNLIGTGTSDTANKDIEVVQVSFVILVRRDGANGSDAVFSILDRLHGDAVDQVNNVPTYGLHRYQPTLTGGVASTHACTAMVRNNYGPIDVENPDTYFAYDMNFTVHIQTL